MFLGELQFSKNKLELLSKVSLNDKDAYYLSVIFRTTTVKQNTRLPQILKRF